MGIGPDGGQAFSCFFQVNPSVQGTAGIGGAGINSGVDQFSDDFFRKLENPLTLEPRHGWIFFRIHQGNMVLASCLSCFQGHFFFTGKLLERQDFIRIEPSQKITDSLGRDQDISWFFTVDFQLFVHHVRVVHGNQLQVVFLEDHVDP